ncbi:hypothetical protein Aduo_011454 [Ancylostoma duodenale]
MEATTMIWLFTPMFAVLSALSLTAGDSHVGVVKERERAPSLPAAPAMGGVGLSQHWIFALPSCGMNEAYTDCTSTCEPKCGANWEMCTKECGPPGCECLPGYFRNADNICVPHAQCTSNSNTSCGTNEEFTPCSGCEHHCFRTKIRCSKECGPPRCQCRDNYFRHWNGSCVVKEHCNTTASFNMTNPLTHFNPRSNGTAPTPPIAPMSCAANQYYTNCTSSCEPRCNGTKDICDKTCGPPGCQCLPGYFRTGDNSCVLRRQCGSTGTTTCGMNEQHTICSGCEKQCSGDTSRCGRRCGPPKCECADNFFRHSNGSCVAKEHCNAANASGVLTFAALLKARGCGENEEFTECMPSCPMTCRGHRECSSTVMATMCTAGCTCKKGYRRNDLGQCVKPRHCYLNPGCKDDEEWSSCASCEGKCDKSTKDCTTCYSGCACKSGYARNASDHCIPTENCT